MNCFGLDFGGGLIAAPLAGVTDAAQRELCARYGADATVTEMVSAKGLIRRGEASEKLLRTISGTKPVGVQLFGADSFAMREAAGLPALAPFDFIDLNMGCPVPKVTKTGAGSALMRSIDRAQTLVRVVREASGKPVTVKFRLGYEERNYLEFGTAMEDAGASAVTLHARTRPQGYAGSADWEAIARLRERLTVPVIANGDIVDSESLAACRRVTGCDLFMIGRAAIGRPWIFDELKGRAIPDVRAVIDEHYRLLSEWYDERYAVLAMRHFLGHYLKGRPGAAKGRVALNAVETVEEAREIVDRIFSSEED